jgi:phosphoserine phosphatase
VRNQRAARTATRRKKPKLAAEALERVLEITRHLALPLDLRTLLTEVIDAAREALDAERGSVFLYDAAAGELVTTVATGERELRIPADKGIVGECAQSRRVINVPDCYADPRFNREVDRQTGYHTRCLLAMPLIGYDDSLVGVLEVLNKIDGVFTDEDLSVAEALAAQCAVALQRARMLEAVVEKEKMERELSVARDIQMRVLPVKLPSPPGYDLAGSSRPAAQTGGDIYDVIALDERRAVLLLGDATGHGVGPALSVTQVRAMLRMALRLGADLDATFAHLNDQLCEDLAVNRFVTVFLGTLDAATHKVTYHSGGQGPILHFHAATGECEWAGASTAPLGLIPGLPAGQPRTSDLAPGDVFGLITDGIFECANADSEEFGCDRVAELVRRYAREPMSDLLARIVEAADRHGGGTPQADDMTLLLVRRLAA